MCSVRIIKEKRRKVYNHDKKIVTNLCMLTRPTALKEKHVYYDTKVLGDYTEAEEDENHVPLIKLTQVELKPFSFSSEVT